MIKSSITSLVLTPFLFLSLHSMILQDLNRLLTNEEIEEYANSLPEPVLLENKPIEHTLNEKKRFPCYFPNCPFKSKSQAGAYEHARFNCEYNTKKITIKCPAKSCFRLFSSHTKLKKHYRSQHPKSEQIDTKTFKEIITKLKKTNKATVPTPGTKKTQKQKKNKIKKLHRTKQKKPSRWIWVSEKF